MADRDLCIATGTSARATRWKNVKMSWRELSGRLQDVHRTPETAEAYAQMSAKEKSELKDHGGFVGGWLRENRRKRANVASRSLLTLDADRAEPGFIQRFNETFPYTGLVYTTHSHTAEAPRVRVIVPLAEDTDAERFVAISRYVADMLGIDQFDPCSHNPHQLMFWPSAPGDGEFQTARTYGPWLNPEVFLAERANWRDPALLPYGRSERESRPTNGQKQEDPLGKEGWVGAFCRAYSVTSAIMTFLSEVYYPTADPNRWGLAGSESQPGVVIYDEDRFAYSQHATDPAYGLTCNAFDLVRIHLFGNEDEKKSFREMTTFAMNDERTKSIAIRELIADFTDAEKEADANADVLKRLQRLEMDREGRVRNSIENISLILENDSKLQGIAYDELSGCVTVRGEAPWKRLKGGWSKSDDAGLQVYIAWKYKGLYAPGKTDAVLIDVAMKRSFHPIREYLAKLDPWDGVKRIDGLFIDWLGAEDNAYTRAAARKFMVAAIARVMSPGCKFDAVPVIVGPQGIGKSTLFARLGGAWFSDSLTLTDMRDKSGVEKLQGYWILELGELAGMRKAEVETVKSFITTQDDKFRPSYHPNVENHPRQCVIVGTTNAETGFLRDVTGNRRFWPIAVTGGDLMHPWDLDEVTIRKLWAEALAVYKEGNEELYLTGEAAELAQAAQTQAMETDDREGLVAQFLEAFVPADWAQRDLQERLDWLDLAEEMREAGTIKREAVCNLEIWCECFRRDASMMRKQDSYEIGAIMRKMENWERSSQRSRILSYGKQRLYQRKK